MSYMRKLHPYLDILVSNIGEVFIPQSGRGKKAHWTFGCQYNDGYRKVKTAGKRYPVQRLVAEAFLGPIPEGYQIDHRNRIKHDNRVENIRIVSRSENMRNTDVHDRVEEEGRTHLYEDEKQYYHDKYTRYFAKNKDKVCERSNSYNQAKRKTHKFVKFANGTHHWVSLPEAEAYLIIPLKQRTFKQ